MPPVTNPIARPPMLLILGALFLMATACQRGVLRETWRLNWYKGNTHLHTLWSDGDAAPEVAVKYYKDRGYNFLAISDHNTLWEGERWFPVDDARDDRLTTERLKSIRETFGRGWVKVRPGEDGLEMRLKTFEEAASHFDEPGRFLLINGEEITSMKSVHVNAFNLVSRIPPAVGETTYEILQKNLDAVADQRARMNRPMAAHLDHPNWGDRVTAEDVLRTRGLRFFEIFNGHAGVKNWGDPRIDLPPTDTMWDVMLAMRLTEGSEGIIYGVGTDDTHNYFAHTIGNMSGGRGFIVVLAPSLDRHEIVRAILRGDFYASTGVEFEEIRRGPRSISLKMREDFGVRYTTQFIGTRKGFDPSSTQRVDENGEPIEQVTGLYSPAIGKVYYETDENPAVYRIRGDELYIRARVVSSKPHTNPFAAGDREMAWTQPFVLK